MPPEGMPFIIGGMCYVLAACILSLKSANRYIACLVIFPIGIGTAFILIGLGGHL